MNEERTTSRKTRVGKVVSDKMDKTVVVIVEDRVAHKTYKKIIGRTYRLKAPCPRTRDGAWSRSLRRLSKEAPE